jgi:hypothetical protein
MDLNRSTNNLLLLLFLDRGHHDNADPLPKLMKELGCQHLCQRVCKLLIGTDRFQLDIAAFDTLPGLVKLDIDVLAMIMQDRILGHGYRRHVMHPDHRP